MAAEDPRLARVTEICSALPEVTRELHGSHASFLVAKKKKFAYFLNDHHGDGIVGIACKVLPGDNDPLVAAHPRFYRPAYLASSGWVGLRLDRGKVDWREVAQLLETSYRLLAPKRLTRMLPEE
ncbi:MAG TPA: MmcQ/YjbR family DNA-binding protein [Bryobacteraceae bacterium]|nr:MmcQ/YjbR family DNA-binding protein [Bryobacteraceae bacterium]